MSYFLCNPCRDQQHHHWSGSCHNSLGVCPCDKSWSDTVKHFNFGDLNLNQLYIISQSFSRGGEKIDADLKAQAEDFIIKVRKEIDRREVARMLEDK